MKSLRDKLREGIVNSIPDIHVNGHPDDTLPGTLNVSFSGCEGEAILLYLDLEGIAVSTGSACASGSLSGRTAYCDSKSSYPDAHQEEPIS